MAIALKKIDFFGGKVLETETGVSPVTVIDAISDTLLSAAESAGPLNFNVQPLATAVVQMGNITEANAVVLLADGRLNVSINGATPYLTKTHIAWNCVVSGITVTNPSSTAVVGVKLYAATASD